MGQMAGKLGESLVARGILAPHVLLDALQRQVKEKITQAFSWTEGSYIFFENEKCREEALPLDIGTISLVAEGIRQYMPIEHLENVLSPFLYKKPVFKFTDDFHVESFALTPKELRVYRALSGRKCLNDVIVELTAGGRITTRDVLALPYLLYEMGVLRFE
jgi:hypothetical protein